MQSQLQLCLQFVVVVVDRRNCAGCRHASQLGRDAGQRHACEDKKFVGVENSVTVSDEDDEFVTVLLALEALPVEQVDGPESGCDHQTGTTRLGHT